VGFTANVVGQYWVDFKLKDKWSRQPFCVPIQDGDNTSTNSYTGAAKKAAGGSVDDNANAATHSVATSNGTPSTTITTKPNEVAKVPFASKCTATGIPTELSDVDPLTFTIVPADQTGDPLTLQGDWTFDVKFEYKPSEDNENDSEKKIPVPKFTANKNGTITCSCGVLDAGECEISVTHKGSSIKDSPWTVVVSESVSGGACEVVTLLVHAVNKLGQVKSVGGDLKEFVLEHSGDGNPQISDVGGGKYQIEFMLHPGENTLNVMLHGKNLHGFPITLHI